ncbi:MAG TPA: hypothetical protein VGW38_23765 [Chloroflexota bacterium]|nr:hypothetical protein [Chloroflexota bacterium]
MAADLWPQWRDHQLRVEVCSGGEHRIQARDLDELAQRHLERVSIGSFRYCEELFKLVNDE